MADPVPTPAVDAKHPLNSLTVQIAALMMLLTNLAANLPLLQPMIPPQLFMWIAQYGPLVFIGLRYISTGAISFDTPFKVPFVGTAPPAAPPK